MPVQLTEKWMREQLAVCQMNSDERKLYGAIGHPYCVAFIIAASEGYPLVLKELLRQRNQKCITCRYFWECDGEWECELRWGEGDPPPPDWYCAEWKPRKETADVNTD